ncbi:MAG: sel1 repeat family protein [Candidatus Riflebacteria bacterium]|nr:sel1 repeat family protein [Candidatus Riflebacteria bacterium]
MKRMSLVVVLVLAGAGAALAWAPSFFELTRAAEQGDTYAQYQLATRLFFGDGCDKDHAAACQWYRRAVMNLRSWYTLQPRRPGSENLTVLREGAEYGDIEAQFHLASKYHYGNGVPQDFTTAATWYRRAALALEAAPWTSPRGSVAPGAGDRPGWPRGDDRYPFDHRTWYPWAWPSQTGWYGGYRWYPWYRAGTHDFTGYDLPALIKAADGGILDAQYQLGLRYYHGDGAPRDPEKAARAFHRAAIRLVAGAFSDTVPTPPARPVPAEVRRKAGRADIPALFQTGARFFAGTKVKQDFQRAAECFKEVIEACADLTWPPFQGRDLPPASSTAIPLLQRAADLNDPAALLELGHRHFFGEGAERDYAKAARLYRLAAEHAGYPWRDRIHGARSRAMPLADLQARAGEGDPEACFQLGDRYFFGKSTPKNLPEAARWYRQAVLLAGPAFPMPFALTSRQPVPTASMGVPGLSSPVDPRLTEADVRAMRELDQPPPWWPPSRYGLADADPRDLEHLARAGGWAEPFPWYKYRDSYRWYRNFEHLRQAAEGGDADAQFQLGATYYFGKGLPLNRDEAARWFRRAADKGHPLARYYLTLVYERHEDRQALTAAAANGNAEAQYQLGTLCHYGSEATRNFDEAARWYEKAAVQGHSMAQYALGLLEFGRDRLPEAAAWLKKSAAQGNALAQYNLAILYCDGKGVNKDRAEAGRLFRRVAEKGGVLAQGMLAFLAAEERGGEGPAAAQTWFHRSVLDRLADPRLDLAIVHDGGLGFAEYTRKAYAWLLLVTAGGSSPWLAGYQPVLQKLEARLSTVEIEQAKALADGLREKLGSSAGPGHAAATPATPGTTPSAPSPGEVSR